MTTGFGTTRDSTSDNMGDTSRVLKHPEKGMTYACPHCDRGGGMYHRKSKRNTHVGNPDDDYRCDKCGKTCNEPVERKHRASNNMAKYAHLSLEDVGLEPHPPEGTSD